VLLICFRNWWLGGIFYPTDADNPIFSMSERISPFYSSIHAILLRHSISGVVLTLGTILALTALVWRKRIACMLL
jgi:hypothetical protein